jgi:hypothetical protein
MFKSVYTEKLITVEHTSGLLNIIMIKFASKMIHTLVVDNHS